MDNKTKKQEKTNGKFEKWILRIVRLKINLVLTIISAGAIMYSAEMLGKAVLLKEIFFWITIIMIIIFSCFRFFSDILDLLEEIKNE